MLHQVWTTVVTRWRSHRVSPHRVSFVVIAVLLGAGTVACSRGEPEAVELDPVIYHVGDSISMSAFWGADNSWREETPGGLRYEVVALFGTRIADHLEASEQFMADQNPMVFVVQLGSNDALAGWDENEWRGYAELVDLAPAQTCVVSVLPFLREDRTSWVGAEFDDRFVSARSDITMITSQRRSHRIADMADFARDNPDLMDDDGLHLVVAADQRAEGDHVRAAYRDWLFEHVAACGA